MKRKVLALLMAATMVFSITACGSKTGEADNTEVVEKEETTEEATEEKEEAATFEFKTYEPNFTASGSDADVYTDNMNQMVEFYESYYGEMGMLEKYAGYEEPITVTTTAEYDAAMQDKFAKFSSMYGETMEQNRYLDMMKRLFNVDVEYKWLAQSEEYNTKLRLDMTSGDLPDIFLVKDQQDVAELANAGLIWDMTEVIDEYASDEMKEIWQSDTGIGMSKVTIDGSVYGLPAMQSNTDNFSYLWIRSDWLEKVGMEHPTNMEELEAVIKAFVEADFDGNGKDDTVGLMMDKDIYYASRGLFNAYGAYPEIWVEEDGGLVWGGVAEENKDALATLASWYEKGYISPEFIAMDGTTAAEAVLSGNCGIVYAGHWFGHTAGDLHELDPESNWECPQLPTGNGEEVSSPIISYVAGWTVVNKEFEHPELAVKMISIMRAGLNAPNGSWFIFEDGGPWGVNPTKSLVSAMDNYNTYLNLQECYNSNDDTSLLKGKAPTYWANLHGDLQWEWELMFGTSEHTPMTVLGNAVDGDRLFYDAFYGAQSELMLERWSTIKDEQKIAFTKIITGEVDVEAGFNEWLETYDSLGGNDITQDVNDWYASK